MIVRKPISSVLKKIQKYTIAKKIEVRDKFLKNAPRSIGLEY